MSNTPRFDPGLWAVVPIKNFDRAKERLAGILTASERRSLFTAMLEDVLQTLSQCPALTGIVLVTREPQAQILGQRYGARSLIEQSNLGHTAASTLGARSLAANKGTSMLQLPADMPLIKPDDINALILAHGNGPAITLAPSRDHRGSNAVLCTPPDLLPLQFGDDSFKPHLAASRALNIEPAVVERPGLALDIDTPDDLVALLETPSATRTYDYLRSSGIDKRVFDQQKD